jgi:hypothetical protein
MAWKIDRILLRRAFMFTYVCCSTRWKLLPRSNRLELRWYMACAVLACNAIRSLIGPMTRESGFTVDLYHMSE